MVGGRFCYYCYLWIQNSQLLDTSNPLLVDALQSKRVIGASRPLASSERVIVNRVADQLASAAAERKAN